MNQKYSFKHITSSQKISPKLWAELMDLDRQHFPYPWSSEEWESLIAQYSASLATVHNNGEACGLSLCLGAEKESVAHLVKILIHPKQQQQGLGHQLFAFHCALLAKRGHETVYLEVEEANHKACSFYLKEGFLVLRKMKGFYGEGRDALAMGFDLTPHIDKLENT